ncbi:hypothetical protein TL16_g09145 [Triparma laevis f. inornata]|uniref:CSN8/PSMD8/EIF3K domain-containing protein n=2 Tax=Triparma laevis TaxID=1534972 RepID=A0A9W6ZE18_9STRA|nr:hypothetical protein TrLO_g5828 [Triparma laevis f. longispina]GMH82097.1 hypothetical protein TL16_g09145 [Triparma laevis f. inornata]
MSLESQVAEVMSSAQFSHESIPILVKSVEEQIKGSTPLNFPANKALLKLYSSTLYTTSQLSPIKSLLLLSLSSSTEFSALLHILPSDALESCETLIAMGKKLEECDFVGFWKIEEGLESNNTLKERYEVI